MFAQFGGKIAQKITMFCKTPACFTPGENPNQCQGWEMLKPPQFGKLEMFPRGFSKSVKLWAQLESLVTAGSQISIWALPDETKIP